MNFLTVKVDFLTVFWIFKLWFVKILQRNYIIFIQYDESKALFIYRSLLKGMITCGIIFPKKARFR